MCEDVDGRPTLLAVAQVVRTQQRIESLVQEATRQGGLATAPVRDLAALVNAGDLDAAEAALCTLQSGPYWEGS